MVYCQVSAAACASETAALGCQAALPLRLSRLTPLIRLNQGHPRVNIQKEVEIPENPWKIHGFPGRSGIPRLRSQEKVEAAQLELERHRKELQRKKGEVQRGDSGDQKPVALQNRNGKEWQFHGSMELECFGMFCMRCMPVICFQDFSTLVLR